MTYAHEFTHAAPGPDTSTSRCSTSRPRSTRGDRPGARARGHHRGRRDLAMTNWMLPNLTPEELREILAAVDRPGVGGDLERTPGILREGLAFPYQDGGTLVAARSPAERRLRGRERRLRRPARVDRAGPPPGEVRGRARPRSRSRSDDIATDIGDGWTEDLQDTLGEFQSGDLADRVRRQRRRSAARPARAGAVIDSRCSAATTARWAIGLANDLGHDRRRARVPGRRRPGRRGWPEPGHGDHRGRQRDGHRRQ